MPEKPSNDAAAMFPSTVASGDEESSDSGEGSTHRVYVASESSSLSMSSSSTTLHSKVKVSNGNLFSRLFQRRRAAGERRHKKPVSEDTTDCSTSETDDDPQQDGDPKIASDGGSLRRDNNDEKLQNGGRVSIGNLEAVGSRRRTKGSSQDDVKKIGQTAGLLESRCSPSEPSLISAALGKKVRLILVGDAGVGKSSFLQTLVTGQYRPSSKISNLLAAHATVSIRHAGQDMELEIQDTAGQERFRSLTSSYYRYAHGCFLFFNVHDKESFASVKDWLEDIKMYHSNSAAPAVLLVGLLHKPQQREPHKSQQGDGGFLRRRSISRGEEKHSNYGALLHHNRHSGSSNNINFNNVNDDGLDKQHDDHLLQPHQNQRLLQRRHSHQLSSPKGRPRAPSLPKSLPLNTSQEKFRSRQISREQAEHMAAFWEIPYIEVDTKEDFDSVLSAVHALLNSVVSDMMDSTRTGLSSCIVPTAASMRGSADWSDDGNRPTCCGYC